MVLMDYSKRCRGCLREEESMLSLFEIYDRELSLADILQRCITVQIHENDNLPPYLCGECTQILTQFYNFTIIYEQSEQHLKSLILGESKNDPHTDARKVCGVTDEADAVNNRTDLESSEKIKQASQYSNSSENEGSDYNNVPDDVQYLTLDTIISENVTLKISNIKNSTQDLGVKNIVQKAVVNPNKVVVYGKLNVKDDIQYLSLDAIKSENFDLNICYKNDEVLEYECSLCGEKHLHYTAFRSHMRSKHSIFYANPAEYSSTVQIEKVKCKSNIEEVSQADEPILWSEASLKCNACEKMFHFQKQLNEHMKVHQMDKQFVCEVCGASFVRKRDLLDHNEGHSTELRHTCPFCKKKFRRRTVYQVHKRLHTHPNHYMCELCGRGFTGRGALKTHHRLIHIRERNFKCMICEQTFSLKSSLDKHVLRHEKRERGEKGFKCNECNMEYCDRWSLKRHVEIKHLGNVVKIPCPACGKEYRGKDNLQRHGKRCHVN